MLGFVGWASSAHRPWFHPGFIPFIRELILARGKALS